VQMCEGTTDKEAYIVAIKMTSFLVSKTMPGHILHAKTEWFCRHSITEWMCQTGYLQSRSVSNGLYARINSAFAFPVVEIKAEENGIMAESYGPPVFETKRKYV